MSFKDILMLSTNEKEELSGGRYDIDISDEDVMMDQESSIPSIDFSSRIRENCYNLGRLL